MLNRVQSRMLGAVVPGSPVRSRSGTIGAVKLVEPDRATSSSEVGGVASHSAPGKHPEQCG